jgi:DNA repair protein SbcD/Mre11
MSIKIFHTSDIHLGMKFAGYPDKVQAKLIEARFETLRRLVKLAGDSNCDLFIIAGDLFHKVSVSKKDVVRAAQILNEFQGRAVVVLPGNHDYLSTGKADIWTQFKESAGDHVVLLEKQDVRSLALYDLNVNLYPAPCDSKLSSVNYIGWVKDALKDASVQYHIGIAHGSLEGFSPDPERQYYPMTVAELTAADIDLWLLGHTHISYPDKPGAKDRIFYPSTPEPDGFDCDHAGMVWILTIKDDKSIEAQRISTGTYLFKHDETAVNSTDDIGSIRQRYSAGDIDRTLLKLKLSGRLPKDIIDQLTELRKFLEDRVLSLEFDDAGVAELITDEDINRTFAERSFPHALLKKLTDDNDQEALQLAYELLLEEKQ